VRSGYTSLVSIVKTCCILLLYPVRSHAFIRSKMAGSSAASGKPIVYYICSENEKFTIESKRRHDCRNEDKFCKSEESQAVNELAPEDLPAHEVYLTSNNIKLDVDYATVNEEPTIDEHDSTLSRQVTFYELLFNNFILSA